MAKVTGATLKGNMDSADTALDAAAASPTDANIDAAIAAYQTVEANGRDSAPFVEAAPGGFGSQKIAADIAAIASGVVRDLRLIASKQHNVAGALSGNAERSQALSLLRRQLSGGAAGGPRTLWASLRDKATTD